MEYNSNNWDEVSIELEPSGKAPKKYGEGVLRFYAAMTLSIIMPRRGWDLIKKTKNYVYLRPPQHERQPFCISIKVPNKQQALQIAKSCFEKGESWMGQIGEWPAFYLHERPQEIYEIIPSEDRLDYTQKLFHVDHPKSTLHIGEFGVWSVELNKIEGDFSFNQHGRIKERDLQDIDAIALLEGQQFTVEQTKYERNSVARQKCIEQFGLSCQVCFCNFSEKYGSIGQGFIHVHHIVPISEQNGAYEVNPTKDLVPVCPNCHAMIHTKIPPYSIEELKTIYDQSQ